MAQPCANTHTRINTRTYTHKIFRGIPCLLSDQTFPRPRSSASVPEKLRITAGKRYERERIILQCEVSYNGSMEDLASTLKVNHSYFSLHSHLHFFLPSSNLTRRPTWACRSFRTIYGVSKLIYPAINNNKQRCCVICLLSG